MFTMITRLIKSAYLFFSSLFSRFGRCTTRRVVDVPWRFKTTPHTRRYSRAWFLARKKRLKQARMSRRANRRRRG
jgi:hypothetical protein